MPHHTRQLPEALVLRWNDRTLRARCPSCLSSHGHAFSGPPLGKGVNQRQPGWRLYEHRRSRRSDCSDCTGGNYQLVFPRSEDSSASGYGWELDREAGEFVTVNSQGITTVPLNDPQDGRRLLPQYEEQHQISTKFEDPDSDVEELIAATSEVTISDAEENRRSNGTPGDSWEEMFQDPKFRRSMYFSHCVLRDIPELATLCRQYPHDKFVGSVDREGNTGTLLAAIEENSLQTLLWLQDHGDPISRANHYGRTPLMEAALWGRLENFEYLIQQDIDIHACDSNGMHAATLAADTQRNAKERAERSGDWYREPANAGRRREQIRALLERLLPPSPGRESRNVAPSRRAFFDRKPDGKLAVYRPEIIFDLPSGPSGPQLQKAFATLDRGPNYLYVNAMSGYSQTGWPNVLDNTVWTERAERLRATFGLSRNKSAASHVEPQLLAYLLDRHSMYMFDDEDDGQRLASAIPPYTLRPIITVSKPELCEKCSEFFERFKAQFPEFNATFHFVGDSAMHNLQVRE